VQFPLKLAFLLQAWAPQIDQINLSKEEKNDGGGRGGEA
jgi:hypothetical protein